MKRMRQRDQLVWTTRFVWFFTFCGCQSNLYDAPEPSVSDTPILTLAKAWYSAYKQNQEVFLYPETKTGSNGLLFYTNPSWNIEFEAKMFYDMNYRDISDKCQWVGVVFSGDDFLEYDRFLVDFSKNKKLTSDLLNRYHELGKQWNDPGYPNGKYDSSFSPELIMKFFK